MSYDTYKEKLVAFYHANKDRISGSVMNGLDFMLSNGNGGKASRKKLPTGTNGDYLILIYILPNSLLEILLA